MRVFNQLSTFAKKLLIFGCVINVRNLILQYESDWLTITESILLKNRKNVPQENAESAPRGRKKLNFMKS